MCCVRSQNASNAVHTVHVSETSSTKDPFGFDTFEFSDYILGSLCRRSHMESTHFGFVQAYVIEGQCFTSCFKKSCGAAIAQRNQ